MKYMIKTSNKKDRSHYLFNNKALFLLIMPIVVEQFMLVLVGMSDSIMVSSIGEAAVSGVSLFDNIMILLIGIFSALATGGAVVVGQLLGQKNINKARHAAEQLLWLTLISSLIVMVVIYLIKNFILYKLFGQISEDVRQYALDYLMIITISVPFIAVFNGGAAIFRTMGNSKISMKVSLMMNIINVIGNAIFIYGLHTGTEGVAISSLISRIIAAIVIIILLLDENLELHLNKKLRFSFDWSVVKSILSIGVPNGFENGMFQLGKVILLSMVATFGTAAIAANAITSIIAILQVIPGIAVSLATTTVIARCIGAGDYEQVEYYNKKLLIIAYVFLWLFDLIFLALLNPILSIYNLSEETTALTRQLVLVHTFGALIIWPISFNLPSTFRAAGDAKFTMLISTCSMWLFRLFMGYIIAKQLGFGVLGVWIAMIIDWTFRSIVFTWRYFSGKWKSGNVIGVTEKPLSDNL